MKYNKEDFSFTVNAEGYMIAYKGKNIGGASIMGKSKSRGRARAKDMEDYRESAKRDIERIINGTWSTNYIKAINEINGE